MAVPAAQQGLRSGWNGRARSLANLLLAPVMAGAVCAAGMAALATPHYVAEARLRVEGRVDETSRSRSQMLTSREFMRQVLRDTNLALRLTEPAQPAMHLAGLPTGGRGLPALRTEQALRDVEQNLSVALGGDGQATIRFVAVDPHLAADVANALADAYVQLQRNSTSFSMQPNTGTIVPARILSRAEAVPMPLFPAPWILALASGIGGFFLALAARFLLRRRRDELGKGVLADPPAPASRGQAQHLPWIGREAETDHEHDVAGVRAMRRVTRDGELADLSRLVELRGEQASLVVVTGAGRGTNAAACALALGRSLSAEKRVVVVCLDVGAPVLRALTEDPRAPGLTDLLCGVASFSEAIHREAGSYCHVIPPGRGARDGDGLIAADRLELILSALERTYDHVVVAAPELSLVEGSSRLAGLRPTLVLVTHPGGRATDAVQAFDTLGSLGFSDIAMVTFAEPCPESLSRAA